MLNTQTTHWTLGKVKRVKRSVGLDLAQTFENRIVSDDSYMLQSFVYLNVLACVLSCHFQPRLIHTRFV